jgi:hypothetical protein
MGANDAKQNFDELCKIYGKEKFEWIQNYPIGEWYKKLTYEKYLNKLKKYKTIAGCICVSCKLSMHWHSTIFCLNNNITQMRDGTVPYMDLYPDQNRKITHDKLKDYYKYFNITYNSPVYNIAEDVEQILYDKGISSTPVVRGTNKDKQVYCAEQPLFAMFVKYYLTKYNKIQYENNLSQLSYEKVEFMKQSVEEFCKNKKESLIYSLLEKYEK